MKVSVEMCPKGESAASMPATWHFWKDGFGQVFFLPNKKLSLLFPLPLLLFSNMYRDISIWFFIILWRSHYFLHFTDESDDQRGQWTCPKAHSQLLSASFVVCWSDLQASWLCYRKPEMPSSWHWLQKEPRHGSSAGVFLQEPEKERPSTIWGQAVVIWDHHVHKPCHKKLTFHE